ncbi:TolC family protein [Pontibacter ruber]|uniref:TolC family protein n=1 Tax=Pontibacter ruber TaxID=1343895 RepID=A0ABW5D0D5_9BACT|nr:TolC family protein [Pontibacter ruber]
MRGLTGWLNFVVNVILLFLGLLPGMVYAQQNKTLTLEQAQELARQNYPVTQQFELLRQTEQYSLENLSKGFLPQFTLVGQATYQSDVTIVPVDVPSIEIPAPAKDQYRINANVSQLLYDGGQIRQQKKVEQLNTIVENQRVEVELHKLRDRINQLYLGTLLLDEQLKQVDLVQQDLETGLRKVEAQVKNGVSFKSNLYLLQAELLNNEQRRAELQASRRATLQTLGLFLGEPLSEGVVLATPAAAEINGNVEIQRPELKLYTSQQTLLEQLNRLLYARNLPRTSLFGESGYGRPGLNFLQNTPDWWYIGGIRVSWPLGNFYTYRNDRKLIDVSQQQTEVQRETFLLNTNAELTQQRAEVDKLKEMLEADREIVALREKVKLAANSQLENGVITANDYLREVYAEDQARQQLILHQLQLLQAQINYKTVLGY